ncbi:MAG: glycoside hydrolase family 3 C-terminal domain-containing protein [Hyphomicrobiaceae bacterium]|nr:glycoside hydrolase family 3 C-terminal domain-containing protein [Hyphomicrobiaceae bacterium]MCC0025118.1 glycoside hydrolase family 3 C-terminal domain-containing protein [Hyphomicrobiaceae bacterium]
MNAAELNELVDKLTLEEQVSLLSGSDFWSLPAIDRRGIGKLRVTDGPNGARGGGSLIGGVKSACFPCGIALGATWNVELLREIGVALAQEVKSKQAHVSLAPTVNIHRSVTNGRNFECYSEDPQLTAGLAVAYIEGLQSQNVSATIKHFAGNESEIERTTINSVIDERSLREIYLVPFEAAVKQAGTWGVMSSYNKLNGTYAAENYWLLTEVLRDDWGYDGVVMSDWFGSRSTAPTINAGLDLEMPGPTRDRGDKLLAAVASGEVEAKTVRARALNVLRLMDRTGAISDHRPFAEHADDRPEHRALIRKAGAEAAVLLKNEDDLLPLDASSLSRIAVIGPNAKVAQIMGGGSAQLNAHYRITPYCGISAAVGDDKLVYVQGCTNHRFEPIIPGPFRAEYFANKNFAGDPVHTEQIDDSTALMLEGVGGGKVDINNFSARFSGTFTPAESGTHRVGAYSAGLVKVFVDGKLVTDTGKNWTRGRTFFEEGCDEVIGEIALEAGRAHEVVIEFVSQKGTNLFISAFAVGIGKPLGDADIARAAEAAASADVALVFVGRNGEWDTEGSDLQNIGLPGRQNELVSAVAAANQKTIVVLQTGGPVEMPWLDEVRGLVQFWYPGQELGNAVADVLFGAAEPSGRLPQTFPGKWADNPTHAQDPEIYPGLNGQVRYEEGLFIGYRHYDQTGISPLFPFGFGLGYTRFSLGEASASVSAGGSVQVSVEIENAGSRRGAAVVQLYVHQCAPLVVRPDKQLQGFAKLILDAGETAKGAFDLSARDFAWFDVANQQWVAEAGDYDLFIGFNAEDLPQKVTISLPETIRLDP